MEHASLFPSVIESRRDRDRGCIGKIRRGEIFIGLPWLSRSCPGRLGFGRLLGVATTRVFFVAQRANVEWEFLGLGRLDNRSGLLLGPAVITGIACN